MSGWQPSRMVSRDVYWPVDLHKRVEKAAVVAGTTVTGLVSEIVRNATLQDLEQVTVSFPNPLDVEIHLRSLYWEDELEGKLFELSGRGQISTDLALFRCVHLACPANQS